MTRRTDSFRKRLVSGLLPALRVLPPRMALRALDGLGAMELRWNLPRRFELNTLLSRAMAGLNCDWQVAPTTRMWAGKSLRWHARDYLLEKLSEPELQTMIQVSGRQHLDRALEGKRGVVLLFNHFGPFLIHSHWLVRNGYDLRWFTERPRRISSLVSATFQTDGQLGQKGLFLSRKLAPNQAGGMLRRALRILDAGMIVQVAGDVRWSTGRAVPGRFLGREFSFTTNWVSLAAHSGAPVVPVFARSNPDGTYCVDFLEPVLVPETAKQPETAAAFVQANLDRLEGSIRANPSDAGDYLYWLKSRVEG